MPPSFASCFTCLTSHTHDYSTLVLLLVETLLHRLLLTFLLHSHLHRRHAQHHQILDDRAVLHAQSAHVEQMLLRRRVHSPSNRVDQQQTDLSIIVLSLSNLVLLTTHDSHTSHPPQLQLQRLLHLLQQLLSDTHSIHATLRVRTASHLIVACHNHLLLFLISSFHPNKRNQLVQRTLAELCDTHLRQIQMESERVLPLLILRKLLDQVANVLNGILSHMIPKSSPCSPPLRPRSASLPPEAMLKFILLPQPNPSSSECVRIGTPPRCDRGRSATLCATPDCPPVDNRTEGNRLPLPYLAAITDRQHILRQRLHVNEGWTLPDS